jgi:hypothetical protein
MLIIQLHASMLGTEPHPMNARKPAPRNDLLRTASGPGFAWQLLSWLAASFFWEHTIAVVLGCILAYCPGMDTNFYRRKAPCSRHFGKNSPALRAPLL